MLVRTGDVDLDRYLEHGRPARHGEQTSLPSPTSSCAPTIRSPREFEVECREPGPLYQMGAGTCYQVGFAGVACGIARGALDFCPRCGPQQGAARRQEPAARQCRGAVQPRPGRGRISASARAFLLAVDGARSGRTSPAGNTITVEQRHHRPRVRATNAIHKAREAVDFAYNAAGATAIFENHPLERALPRHPHRDPATAGPGFPISRPCGAWMMGADADLTFV